MHGNPRLLTTASTELSACDSTGEHTEAEPWQYSRAASMIEYAQPGMAAAKRAFAGAEESYGLNREELKRTRWKTYAEFVVMKDSLKAFEAAGLEPALQQRIRDQIRAMTKFDAPYAGMVRYFVKASGLIV